jgi:hypothetical protein
VSYSETTESLLAEYNSIKSVIGLQVLYMCLCHASKAVVYDIIHIFSDMKVEFELHDYVSEFIYLIFSSESTCQSGKECLRLCLLHSSLAIV